MLSVFGDESADETTQRVFAVAGVVGTDEMWATLEAAWLESTGGIPFHAKDCESDQADYAHTAHEDNLNLYRDLTLLLAKSGLVDSALQLTFRLNETSSRMPQI